MDESCTADIDRSLEKMGFQDVKDSLRKSMWNGEIIAV